MDAVDVAGLSVERRRPVQVGSGEHGPTARRFSESDLQVLVRAWQIQQRLEALSHGIGQLELLLPSSTR